MRLMFIGDIVGKSGRQKVIELTNKYRSEYNLDYVIANGENSAHGKGITKKIYHDLLRNGVDFITLGNHAFSKSEIKLEFNELKNMIRPGNLKDTYVGEWHKTVKINDLSVCICNLLGASFMEVCDTSPFVMMEDLLNTTNYDLYLVDLHAETTGEKLAFANHFSDRVQMIVGTHTHVQTSDERIINNCAYITDVGMCGPYDSIIGRDKDEVISRFISDKVTRFTVAEGESTFSAVIVEFDEESKKAISIDRIYLHP